MTGISQQIEFVAWWKENVQPHGGDRPRARAVLPGYRSGSAVQPPLRLITTRIGMLWRTAVSSSSALMPKEPSPCTTMTCLSGLASLAPMPNGSPTPHGAERPGIETMAGHKGRHRLAAEIQDFLAVDHQDGVALHEVLDFVA